MMNGWIDHLSNSQELKGKFPDGELILTGLLLLKLEYSPGNILSLTFFQERVPDTMPVKWRQMDPIGMQLEFRMGLRNLAIQVSSELQQNPPMKVSLEPAGLLVTAELSDEVRISASTFFVTLNVTPLKPLERL